MPPVFDDFSGFDTQMSGDTPPQAPKPQPKKDESAVANTIFDYVELFAVTIFFILVASFFLFRHTVVEGDSMNHTLADGEHLIISDAFYTPEAGDIIVFESLEETGISGPVIKRIIATAGQTVTITEQGVMVDGELLDESGYVYPGGSLATNNYLTYQEIYETVGTPNADGTAYTYTVDEGEVFVLGDNRFNSKDSRMFGSIDEECILGRVLFRITPISKFGGVD